MTKNASRASLVLGGCGVAVSPTLPWISVPLFGGVSLFRAASATQGQPISMVATIGALILVVVGVAGALLAAVPRVSVGNRRLMIVTSAIVTGAVVVLTMVDLQAVSDTKGLADIGFGPLVAILGAGGMLAGAVGRAVDPDTGRSDLLGAAVCASCAFSAAA